MWYDTREGIEESILNLAGLHNLIHARYTAGYKHKERMSEWVVKGLWYFDTCGNCGRSQTHIPSAPSVTTIAEFRTLMKSDYAAFNMTNSVPPADVVCSHCKKAWTIHDCHNALYLSKHESISFKDYVGRPLKEVCKEICEDRSKRPSFHLIFGTERSLRNNKYIDLQEDPKFKPLKINEFGWVEPPSKHIIEEGDEGFFHVFEWFHQNCHKKVVTDKQRSEFEKSFKKAGFIDYIFEEIPNEYCYDKNCYICGPWFSIKTRFGAFKIGWRKRVVNIEFKNFLIDMTKLFKNEDVTKETDYIHAWGYEKVTEYLERIYEELNNV